MREFGELLSTPWLGNVFGVLGLVAAFIFYLRSRRIAGMAFGLDEFTIVGGFNAAFPQEVEIRFAGSTVERITATRVVLWNSGNVTLRGNEVVSADPIRLEVVGKGEILKVETRRVTREVNSVLVARRPGTKSVVDVTFDYLDPGDGITMVVIHSGSTGDVRCRGTMRGVPEGISRVGKLSGFPGRGLLWTWLVFGTIILSLIFCVFMWNQWFPSIAPSITVDEAITSIKRTETFMWMVFRWVMILGVLFFVALPLVLLWVFRRRYPSVLDQVSNAESVEREEDEVVR